MNFNGSGGIWRRQAIEDAGGWQGDTLTEDLDLSFRAQLRGWRMKFLPQLVCPAELPVQMSALKSQQHRWAKGSIQTAKKLASRLLRAPLPWFTKYQAFLHLAGYLMHPFILLAALTSSLPFWFEEDVFSRGPLIGSGLFTLATFGPLSMCLYTQAHLYANWKQRLYSLLLLLVLGTGLALNNTRAILEALLGWHSPFVRTPKFHIETAADTWRDKRYRLAFPWTSLGRPCWPVTVPTACCWPGSREYRWSIPISSSIPLVLLSSPCTASGRPCREELPLSQLSCRCPAMDTAGTTRANRNRPSRRCLHPAGGGAAWPETGTARGCRRRDLHPRDVRSHYAVRKRLKTLLTSREMLLS